MIFIGSDRGDRPDRGDRRDHPDQALKVRMQDLNIYLTFLNG
jgi:hypothetical protein